MSSNPKNSPEACLNTLDKLFTDLIFLVTSVEKGSGAELTARLRNVESELANFKEQVKSIPDINVDESRERQQIGSLYRQIHLKDELIKSLAAFKFSDDGPKSGGSSPKNKADSFSNDEKELPLPRQQKGLETQKELVKGFWVVEDMFTFENVGFTNAMDRMKYLICADCDYGPIGYVDPETKFNLIAPSRFEKPVS